MVWFITSLKADSRITFLNHDWLRATVIISVIKTTDVVMEGNSTEVR